jgi:2Fe-2S ferredoxin
MPKVTFLPSGKTIEIDGDTTIREAAHIVDVSVHDRCGGMGACCNCIITVMEGMGNICPKSIVEEAVFYLSENDRLSCQCKLTGDVVVKTI